MQLKATYNVTGLNTIVDSWEAYSVKLNLYEQYQLECALQAVQPSTIQEGDILVSGSKRYELISFSVKGAAFLRCDPIEMEQTLTVWELK